MKYRKKPDVVDAVKYKLGLEDAFGYRTEHGGFGMIHDGMGRPVKPDSPHHVLVPLLLTLDEYFEIEPGDWILTSVDSFGRTVRSVCRGSVFSAMYETAK